MHVIATKMYRLYIYTVATVPHRTNAMSKKFPIMPTHPERVCWGCDRYCPADALVCGNDTERTQHPAELFGADWREFGRDARASVRTDAQRPPSTASPIT